MIIEASPVSKTTIQDASVLESCVQRIFAPAPIWTEAMLAALQTGVKGGKWHSSDTQISSSSEFLSAPTKHHKK